MKMKDTTRRSVRFLFSIRRYLIFFLLMAFVITCCMILFLNMMTRATGFELTQEYIEQAAKVTFLNVALLSLLCTVIDGIRRRIMVKRPVKRIVSAAEQIMKGDFSVRIPSLRSADKMSGFDVIADYFNQMAEELSGTETLRTDFIANVSHELKTPLASIKLLSDSILQNEMDPETQREFIGDIGREADRLGRLTQKLLTLTKLDSSVEEEREILDAAPVVRKVVRMLLPLARLRGIGIDTTFEPDCSVMTVEDDLYQIVFNLTENAIKYNRQDGWVGVSIRRAGDQVELRVEDSGAGIPPESMEHIFERFYRVDKARSRAAGGAGLGLSIVHDMVERSYGTITVQARPGGGTIFTVRFPHFDLEEDET